MAFSWLLLVPVTCFPRPASVVFLRGPRDLGARLHPFFTCTSQQCSPQARLFTAQILRLWCVDHQAIYISTPTVATTRVAIDTASCLRELRLGWLVSVADPPLTAQPRFELRLSLPTVVRRRPLTIPGHPARAQVAGPSSFCKYVFEFVTRRSPGLPSAR